MNAPTADLEFDIAYGEEIKRWSLHVSVGIAF